jgi:hypothetical protein
MNTINQNIIDRYTNIKQTDSFKTNVLEVYEPKLIEQDYLIGYIYRFFIRKRNEPNGIIYEIDKFTNKKYLKDPLYITTKIRWKVSGKKDEVETANKKSIGLGKKDISNLDTYLQNHSKFWKG